MKRISISKMEDKCDLVAGLLKSLSHPGRLLILGHLAVGEKTVSELQGLCELSQSQLSQFLNRMRLEGLIQCRRNGRFMYYSIANRDIESLILSLQNIFC